jgi:hypothetical protein
MLVVFCFGWLLRELLFAGWFIFSGSGSIKSLTSVSRMDASGDPRIFSFAVYLLTGEAGWTCVMRPLVPGLCPQKGRFSLNR